MIRTDALKGIPHINMILGAFIVFVNSVATIISPYLIFLEQYDKMQGKLRKYCSFFFSDESKSTPDSTKNGNNAHNYSQYDSDSEDGIQMIGNVKKSYAIPAQINAYDSDDSEEPESKSDSQDKDKGPVATPVSVPVQPARSISHGSRYRHGKVHLESNGNGNKSIAKLGVDDYF